MALLFMDSFATYASTELTRKYSAMNTSSNTWAIEATGGRSGNACLVMTKTWSGGGTFLQISPSRTQSGVLTPTASGVIGFGIKVTNLNRTQAQQGNGFFKVNTGLTFSILATGAIQIARQDTSFLNVLATTTACLSEGQWAYLEFKWLTHASAGSAEVRCDGISVGSVSGVDTLGQNQPSVNWEAVSLFDAYSTYQGTSITIRLCDLYLCDLSGSVNNDFLGPVSVGVLMPTGAGNSSQWTPSAGNNWDCVEELDADDDTTYVETSTVNNKDTYAYGNVPSGAVIKAVQISPLARLATDGGGALKAIVRHSSTDYAASVEHGVNGVGYRYLCFPYDTNPGASGWTESDVNAAEFGFQKTA